MSRPLSASILLISLVGCTAGSEAPDLEAMYRDAVADAAVVDDDEIVDDLVAIREDNGDLVRDEEGRVLMVTWTDYAGYDTLAGMPTELGVEVWTTAAPQLQEFCKGAEERDAALGLRLEQLLGLPAVTGKDRVVELWVPADAMFRPAPDPEIDDSVAGVDYPPGTDQAHIDWIEAQKARSYGENGYPWTRLGYTYDWSGGSEVGLSEFVVRAGSEVIVHDVSSLADYCAQ